MLWLKAFHVVSVISWFAALLYLPRLFVYHAQIQGATIDDPVGNARFKVMELKLLLVFLLVGYHGACFALLQQFAADRNVHSERWYRVFNELPALLLIGIVILVVVKPF